MVTRTFDKAPSTAPLMLKAVLPALPVIGGLPGVKHAKGSVPDIVLERKGVATDLKHLEAYNEVCGFPRGDHLPATYQHMAAFGLQMALMTDTAFPFAPMGLVHLRNSITQHRPIGVDETYDLTVRASDLRTHPKGSLVDLITEVSIDGTIVWEELTTLFSRHKGGAAEKVAAPLTGVEAPDGVVHWKLTGDLGRRYGSVSGDRNPIHLYALTAKAFGFPRQIAHGMWSKARCLAALDGRLPDAVTVEVAFKKPVLLPGTVLLGSARRDQGYAFALSRPKDGKPHLLGRFGPAKI